MLILTTAELQIRLNCGNFSREILPNDNDLEKFL